MTREELYEAIAARFSMEDLDEHIHELKLREATKINMSSLNEQVDYMIECGGQNWVAELLGIVSPLQGTWDCPHGCHQKDHFRVVQEEHITHVISREYRRDDEKLKRICTSNNKALTDEAWLGKPVCSICQAILVWEQPKREEREERKFFPDKPPGCPQCGSTDLVVSLPAAFAWDGTEEGPGPEDLRACEFPLEDDAMVVCNECGNTFRVKDVNTKGVTS